MTDLNVLFFYIGIDIYHLAADYRKFNQVKTVLIKKIYLLFNGVYDQ